MMKKSILILSVMLFLCVALVSADYNMTPADIYYGFDNNTLNDWYGNYSATNSGTTNTTGIIYSGRALNGVNQYFTMANTLFDTGNVFTINMWIKPNQIENVDGIISKRTATIDFDSYFSSTGNVSFRALTDSGTRLAQTSTTISTGTWHMLTIVINGSKTDSINIYIDGTESDALADEGTFSTINDLSGANVQFGKLDASTTYMFNGSMDEIGIWKGVELNDTEILNLYNGSTGLQPPFEINETPLVINNYFFLKFYDEISKNPINYTAVSVDLISDNYSNNYSTSNGTIYLLNIEEGDYTIRYSANGFTRRFYHFNSYDERYNNISLYLLNNTVASNVTVTVIDQVSNPVINALVKALRYNLATNSYILQEVAETDNNGEAILSLQLNGEYYKFMVEYNNETKLTTSPMYLTSTTYTLQINTESNFGQDYYDYQSLDYQLGFISGNDTFLLNYNDINGVTSTVCLNLYKLGVVSTTYLNSSCSSSASGSMLLTVYDPVNSTTYAAIVTYIDGDGDEVTLASSTYTYPDSVIIGVQGLFYQILFSLVILVITLLALHPSFIGITLPLSFLLGSFMQLNQFSWPVLTGLIVVGLGITAMFKDGGR